MKLKNLLQLILLLIAGFTTAQVEELQYQLRYNASNSKYEIFIVVAKGSASTLRQRTQYNAQVSLVLPTRSKIDSMTYSGAIGVNGSPLQWNPSSTVINPNIYPGYDFVSITPNLGLNGSHQYPSLKQGDTVQIFSFKVNPQPICLNDVRIFENITDPKPFQLEGGNFSNGITIGGFKQLYAGNLSSSTLPNKVDIPLDPTNFYKVGDKITLPNLGAGTWKATNPLIAEVVGNVATLKKQGLVSFAFVDDAKTKCSTSVGINVKGTILYEAGPDQTICKPGTIELKGFHPTEFGYWTAIDGGNSVVISNPFSANTTANINTVGEVIFTYGSSFFGFDTMKVNVSQEPLVDVNKTSVCVGSELLLTSSEEGTWKTKEGNMANFNNNIATPFIAGKTSFVFTSNKTGCTAETQEVEITDQPIITFKGSNKIYKDETLNFSSSFVGEWQSSDPSVATISPDGVLVALALGSTKITLLTKECISNEIIVIVINKPAIVSGKIFLDKNSNGNFDATEVGLPKFGIRVKDLDNSKTNIYYADNDGNYNITIVDAKPKQLVFFASYGKWANGELFDTVTFENRNVEMNKGFKVNEVIEKAELSLFSAPLKCNSIVALQSSTLNTGNDPISGRMVLNIDPRSKIISATPSPTKINDFAFEFYFTDLQPGKSFQPQIEIKVPAYVKDEDFLNFKVSSYNGQGDLFSTKDYTNEIKCAFDPNDKMSWPNRSGEFNLTLNNEILDYVIRFQNDGSDAAQKVVVKDVLDGKLDKRSLIIKESSHKVKVEMDEDTVYFIFEEINLPSSKENFKGSQGYVAFSIQTFPNTGIGSVINNTAAIIFDRNEPISTNTVKNTITDLLPCTDLATSIKVEQDVLIADPKGKKFEWYDCDKNEIIGLTITNKFKVTKSGSYSVRIYGNDCATFTSCQSIILSAIKDELAAKVSIYPNPANDFINVSSELAISQINIYNSLGVKVMNTTSEKIDVRSLPSGIYQVEVNTEKGIVKKSIILVD